MRRHSISGEEHLRRHIFDVRDHDYASEEYSCKEDFKNDPEKAYSSSRRSFSSSNHSIDSHDDFSDCDTSSASEFLEDGRSKRVQFSNSQRTATPLAACFSACLGVVFRICCFSRFMTRSTRWVFLSLVLVMSLFGGALYRESVKSKTTLAGMQEVSWSQKPMYSYPTLKGYFAGLRSLVKKEDWRPEWPPSPQSTPKTAIAKRFELPHSRYYEPRSLSDKIVECFLDHDNNVSVPKLSVFDGIVQDMPLSALGSHSLIGIREDLCYDRFGRYSAYGYGYSKKQGGLNAGLGGDRLRVDEMLQGREIDYSNIKWSTVQSQCSKRNQHRFSETSKDSKTALVSPVADDPQHGDSTTAGPTEHEEREISAPSTSRKAFVIRTWHNFEYTAETILNLRALISELALASGGEYTVQFLIHVKDDNIPIWSDRDTYERILKASLPAEFEGMGTLWSERQMFLIYGGVEETKIRDIPTHSVYRSAHFSLQYFAQAHPEFEHFWNWEMDVRYTGHWLDLIHSSSQWANRQPRKGLWERNARFYMPEVHGSWEEFSNLVKVQNDMHRAATAALNSKSSKAKNAIWGPHPAIDTEHFDGDPVPPASMSADNDSWGVGEEADLITFNPQFDPDGVDWLWSEDVTGYNRSQGLPPRRASLITTSRLSRRLLNAMHNETALSRHTMFTEMFPSSVALHHGLKSVFVPHPVYVDRAWPLDQLSTTFTCDETTVPVSPVRQSRVWNQATRSRKKDCVFDENGQAALETTTWHFRSAFAEELWQRWWGIRVHGEGGEMEEMDGGGRMCLPPMLLHPIKNTVVPVEGRKEGEIL